jgi:hypothetical protein
MVSLLLHGLTSMGELAQLGEQVTRSFVSAINLRLMIFTLQVKRLRVRDGRA